MKKNRFAQPLYGKIIYIYETDLKKEELATIFDPSTYWIDVTGLDCEVGYILEYVEGGGLRFVPPPNEEYTFEEEQARMLEKVDVWTESKITGGFISECTGNPVRYDSDKDTQLTMQGIALNVSTERFANEYPLGCSVRGYKEGETEKTIQYLNATQVYTWCADLSSHIGACKQQGWIKRAQVEAALSKEDLDAIRLD